MKRTSDSDSTSKNTWNKRKKNILFYMTLKLKNSSIIILLFTCCEIPRLSDATS